MTRCQHPTDRDHTESLLTRCPDCGAECSRSQIGDDGLCYDERCSLHAFEGLAEDCVYCGAGMGPSDAVPAVDSGLRSRYVHPEDYVYRYSTRYTDSEGVHVEIWGDSLEEIAEQLPADYDGPSLRVLDEPGFTRGWIQSRTVWRAV